MFKILVIKFKQIQKDENENRINQCKYDKIIINNIIINSEREKNNRKDNYVQEIHRENYNKLLQ